MSNENQSQQPQVQQVTLLSLLEGGLETYLKVTREVKLEREELLTLLNFEQAVRSVISSMKVVEGKSFDEIVEMRKKIEANAENLKENLAA